jgi:hypothetical protein
MEKRINFTSKHFVQKVIADSLSSSTLLVQSMGYCPLRFDKETNSFRFSYFSFPFLIFLFHIILSFAWSGFFLLHLDGFHHLFLNLNKYHNGSSVTLMLCYLFGFLLASLGSSVLRLIFFFKRHEFMEFYNLFHSEISENVVYYISYELNEVERVFFNE